MLSDKKTRNQAVAKIKRFSTAAVCAAKIIVFLCAAPAHQALALNNQQRVKDSQKSSTKIASYTSKGNPITLDKIDLTMTPPKGWNVKLDTSKFDLVAEEPIRGKIKAGKRWINFKRSITVKAIDHPDFIDASRAKTFPEELALILKSDPNAQVLNARTFSYLGKDDGITAYSTTTQNGVAITQLHVLVGGSDRQYLLTYSDLSSRYIEDSEAGKIAWTSLTKVQTTGTPPWRYTRPLGFASIALIGIVGILMLRHLLRKKELQHFTLIDESAAGDFWSQNRQNIFSDSQFDESAEASLSINQEALAPANAKTRHKPNGKRKGNMPSAYSHHSLADEFSVISAVS